MTITNPEFVDSTDLDAWAPLREAQELLPRLIRHLLSSTPGVIDLSVRPGEGIGVSGWDGRADGGAGTAYVPPGESLWELSTSHDPRDQAQRNYKKRTKDTASRRLEKNSQVVLAKAFRGKLVTTSARGGGAQ